MEEEEEDNDNDEEEEPEEVAERKEDEPFNLLCPDHSAVANTLPPLHPRSQQRSKLRKGSSHQVCKLKDASPIYPTVTDSEVLLTFWCRGQVPFPKNE